MTFNLKLTALILATLTLATPLIANAIGFDTLQDIINTPLKSHKVAYVIDDAKLQALNPTYYGPDTASESSKRYVKHAKDIALSMSTANITTVGWKATKEVCTSAGFFKNKLAGQYKGWPLDAEGAVERACSMFTVDNIGKIMSLGSNALFKVQEDGRLLPLFYYTGNVLGKSKSKEIVCSHTRLAARTSKRMTTKEFGKNPEVIIASEALAMTWEATLKSWECGGVSGYIGW
jgi:hypothetical protein